MTQLFTGSAFQQQNDQSVFGQSDQSVFGQSDQSNRPLFARPDEFLQQAKQTLPHKESEQTEDANGEITEFGKAIRRGFLQLNADGKFIGAMLVGLFGATGARDFLIKSAIETSEEAGSERLRAKVGRLEDIDKPMDVGTFILNSVAEQFPNLLLMIGTGGVGGAVARALGKKAAMNAASKLIGRQNLRAAFKGKNKDAVGKVGLRAIQGLEDVYEKSGALAGATALSVGLEVGTIGIDIAKETGQFRPGVAMSFGTVAGVIDALPFAPLFEKLGVAKKAKKAMLKNFVDRKILKTFVSGGIRQFFYEGSTELVQSVIENSALKFVDDNATIFEGKGLELLNAFTIGGIVGGMTGGAVELASRAQTRGALRKLYGVNDLHTALLSEHEAQSLSPEEQSIRRAALDTARALRFSDIDPNDVPRRIEFMAENEVMTKETETEGLEEVVGQRTENVGGVKMTFATSKDGTPDRLKQILYPEEWTGEQRLRWLSHRRGDIGLDENPDVTNAEMFQINLREKLKKANDRSINKTRKDIVGSLVEFYPDPEHVNQIMTVIDALTTAKIAQTPGLTEDDVISQMFTEITADPAPGTSLFSDDGNDADVFYSRLRDKVSGLKQKSLPADQLLRSLGKAQADVSPMEAYFTGLDEYLNDRGTEHVTQEEILQYLDENKLVVDTVILSGSAIIDPGFDDTMVGGTSIQQAMIRWFPPQHKELAESSGKFETLMAETAEKLGIPFDILRKAYIEASKGSNLTFRSDRHDMVLDVETWVDLLIEYDGWYVGETNIESDPRIARVKETVEDLKAEFFKEVSPIVDEFDAAATELWELDLKMRRNRSQLHVHPIEFMRTDDHFGVENLIAHVRFQDMEIKGKRTLVIDEIQSDWARAITGSKIGVQTRQDVLRAKELDKTEVSDRERRIELLGRAKLIDEGLARLKLQRISAALDGSQGNPEIVKIDERIKNLTKSKSVVSAELETIKGRRSERRRLAELVPDMPWSKKWIDMTMKRMLRFAIDNGYDQLAWTDGETQALRWPGETRDKFFKQTYDRDAVKVLKKAGSTLGVTVEVNKEKVPSRGQEDLEWRDIKRTALEGSNTSEDQRAILARLDEIESSASSDFYRSWLNRFFDIVLSEDEGLLPVQTVYMKLDDNVVQDRTVEDGVKVLEVIADPEDGYHADSVLKKLYQRFSHNTPIHVAQIPQELRLAALRNGFALMSPTARAAVQFNQIGQATMHVFKNATVEDGVHEVLHIARRMLFGEDLSIVEEHLGVKDGIWTRENEEQFVKEAMEFAPQGKTKSPKMQGVLGKFWGWFRTLFGMARDNGIEVNKDFAGAMDRLFGRAEYASDVSAVSTQHDIDRLSGHERLLLKDEISVAKATGNLEFYQDPAPLTPEVVAARESAGTLVKLTNDKLVDPPSGLSLLVGRIFSTGPNAVRKLAPVAGDKLATLLESYANNVRQKLARSERLIRKMIPIRGEFSTKSFTEDERRELMDVVRGNKVAKDEKTRVAAENMIKHIRLMEKLAKKAKFMERNPLIKDIVSGSKVFKGIKASTFRLMTDDARRQLHERKGPLYDEMVNYIRSKVTNASPRQASDILFQQFSSDGDASFIPFEREIIFDLPDKFFIQDAREYMDKMAMGFWKRYYEIRQFGYSTMGKAPRKKLESETSKGALLKEIELEGGSRAQHFASNVYDEVLGRLKQSDWIRQMEDHFLRPLRLFNAIRLLGLAVNPFAKQLTQPFISGIPKFGFVNFTQSLYDLVSGRGAWKTVLQSGAIDTGTLDRLVQGQSTGTAVQKQLDKVAKASLLIFKLGDQAGRVVAAQQGVRAAKKYLQAYKTGTIPILDKLTITKLFASKRQVKNWYKEQLKDLGVRNVDQVVKRGEFNQTELQNIAQTSSDLLLFQTGPTDLPLGWSSNPIARTVFQFYTFAWKQAALASSFVTKEAIERSNYMPLMRLVVGSQVAGSALIGLTKGFVGEERLETEEFKKFWNNFTFIGTWGLVMDMFDADFGRISLGPSGDLAQALAAETTKVIHTEIDDVGKQLKQSAKDLWQSQVSLVKTINKKKRGDLLREFDTWTAQVSTSKKQAKATGVLAATGVFPTSGQRSTLWRAAQAAIDGGNEDSAYDKFELEMRKRIRSGSKIEQVIKGLLNDRSPTQMYVELDLRERKIFNRAYGSPLVEGKSQTRMYDANAAFVMTALKASQFAHEFVRENYGFIVEHARARGKK